MRRSPEARLRLMEIRLKKLKMEIAMRKSREEIKVLRKKILSIT